MRFTILLYVLYLVLKLASYVNNTFKKYISVVTTKVLIKTADGRRARVFIFDKGKLSTMTGDQKGCDVALVWKDAKTAFSVMTDKRKDASFNAAAEGKLVVEGMSVYAQWFEAGIKLVM
ncbi:MAG: hypothetical protein JRH15_12740 [Deltaproteobacteria bacterium]|nr:hypothetical protein [Deltaproteobacteria bacterium]